MRRINDNIGVIKKIFISVVCIILVLALLESFYRLATSQKNKLPFFYSNKEMIYPALANAMVHYSPKNTNVLLLGGSVLDWNYPTLKEINKNSSIEFYNMATPAHTSLDSLYKYRYLISKGYHFDYVIFYDTINEVRANNVPPELYYNDYRHYSFYRIANAVFKDDNFLSPIIRKSALCLRLYQVYTEIRFKDETVPKDGPKEEWIKYGGDIKTKETFRNNLQEIINISKKENSTLIAPKFAFNLPGNYTFERFINNSLGYSNNSGCCAVKIWGSPYNVVKGIKAHNEIIESLESELIFINTDNISNDISNFFDICHFSEKGNKEFANLIIKSINDSKG